MSKRKLTYQDFRKYFSNNLQKEDKHAFEKEMMQDAFEEEAFDGLSQLSQFELGNDISELKAKINNRIKNPRRLIPVWFKYAASVIILVGMGFSLFFINSRFWNESGLKEQISQGMEIADSIILDAEEEFEKIAEISRQDTAASKNLIAENKPDLQEDSKPKESKPLQIVENDILIEDELLLDDAEVSETDMEQTIKIVEFEEKEEIVDEEFVQYNEVAEEKSAMAKKSMDKSAEPSSNITIRGVSTQTEKNSPLYVIDGKPVDLSNAKTIHGRILSSEDKVAVEGVSVNLKEMPIFGTVTDANGEFNLTIPSDQELKTLIASFVGMESQEIPIDDKANLLVYMEPEVLEMDEVVVSGASKQKGNTDGIKTEAKPPLNLSLNKYKKQIEQDLDYTKLKEYPGKYNIKLSFIVLTNGSISNFVFVNSPNQIFSDEIIRVMKQLGNWIPATMDSLNATSKVDFTLRFEVKE